MPFANRTTFNHLNIGLVRYSDGYCTWTIIITDLHSDDNLRVKDPSLSLSHYISTLALLLPDHEYVVTCAGELKYCKQGLLTGKGVTTWKGLVLPESRDSGNDFCFPDFASHTVRFCLIFVRISSVVSFRVDICQLEIRPSKNKTEKRLKSFPLSLHFATFHISIFCQKSFPQINIFQFFLSFLHFQNVLEKKNMNFNIFYRWWFICSFSWRLYRQCRWRWRWWRWYVDIWRRRTFGKCVIN